MINRLQTNILDSRLESVTQLRFFLANDYLPICPIKYTHTIYIYAHIIYRPTCVQL